MSAFPLPAARQNIVDATRCSGGGTVAKTTAKTSKAKLYRRVFETTVVGLAIVGADGRLCHVNEAFCRLCGHSAQSLRTKLFADITHPDDIEADFGHLRDLSEGRTESYTLDKRYIRADGSHSWVNITVSILDDDPNSTERYLAVVQSIAEQKKLETTRNLLVNELNHRVKNTLAVVLGIVQKTLATATSLDTFGATLQPRLLSISRAHDLLTQSEWTPLRFSQLFDGKLSGPFAAYQAQYSWQGDDTSLTPQQSVLVNLVLHELSTNAVKHGALSKPDGQIQITSRTFEENGTAMFEMNWQETGGPPVEPPKHDGFGSFVLNRGAVFGLNAVAARRFEKRGFGYALRMPVENGTA